MIYQLTAILFTDDEDTIDDIKDKILDHWHQMKVIKPGQPDQECSTLDVIQCHHDLTPPEPCDVTFHIDNCPDQPD